MTHPAVTALEQIKTLGKTVKPAGQWTDLERAVFEIAGTALRALAPMPVAICGAVSASSGGVCQRNRGYCETMGHSYIVNAKP